MQLNLPAGGKHEGDGEGLAGRIPLLDWIGLKRVVVARRGVL